MQAGLVSHTQTWMGWCGYTGGGGGGELFLFHITWASECPLEDADAGVSLPCHPPLERNLFLTNFTKSLVWKLHRIDSPVLKSFINPNIEPEILM